MKSYRSTENKLCYFYFCANLFKEKLKIISEYLSDFLENLSIPLLSNGQKQLCDEELSEKDIMNP